MSLFKKIILGTALLLVLIQFIRPHKNKGAQEGPEDIAHVVAVPAEVKLILKTACYDCHSNRTEYPWYAEIMPIGWWLNHHVNEGKEHLNFSEFVLYPLKKQDHKLEETKEEVAEHEMPLSSYIVYHSGAKLSDEQIRILSEWVDASRLQLKRR